MSYVSPHEMGRHIVFSSVVCLPVHLSFRPYVSLSVRPSVCMSVRHAFVSALYLLNPWWDLQITLHTFQVWWDNVQCLCLTKVGLRTRSQSKIKHCMTVFRVCSIYFEPLMGFNKQLCTNVKYDETMQCLTLTKDDSRSMSQSKIKHCMTVFRVRSLSFEPLVGFITFLKC